MELRARYCVRPSAVRRFLSAGAVCFAVTGCRSEPVTDAAAEVGMPDRDEIAGLDPIYEPVPELETLPEARIYHTLTDHDWYARAEPLQHQGVPYEPAGTPIVASLDEMQHAGVYQGVDYYTRVAEPEPVLYVPVFQGYWLRFFADTATPGG